MKRGLVLVFCAVAGLSACSKDPNRIFYDGIDFRPKSDRVSDDKRVFLVSVAGAAVNADAARKAAVHAGVQYCMKHFGASPITWADDPLADAAGLLTAEGVLAREGRCDHR